MPKPAKTLPASGYVRVSTDRQASEGVSLEAQEARIRAYADLHGLALGEVIRDEGISAGSVTGRPGMVRLLELVRARKVSAVVLWKLDRAFRCTRDALDAADLCRKHGVALHSISEKIDTSSPVGVFFYSLLASLGQLERGLISERTTSALRFRRSQGFKNGGRVPYGWAVRLDAAGRKRLVPVPGEQAVLDRISAWRNAGRSLPWIAARLNSTRTPTKNGGTWHVGTVERIAHRLRQRQKG